MSTYNIQGNWTDTGRGWSKSTGSVAVTTGDGIHEGSVGTTTGEGSITIHADITGGFGPGFAVFMNRSTTAAQTIQIGMTTGVYFAKLAAVGNGVSFCVLPLDGAVTTIFHKAGSGTPQLFFEIHERNA